MRLKKLSTNEGSTTCRRQPTSPRRENERQSRAEQSSNPKTDSYIKMVHSSTGFDRAWAIKRLGESGDKNVIPVLIELLDDNDLETRKHAVSSLAQIGLGTVRTQDVTALKSCLNRGDDYMDLHGTTISAISTIDPMPKEFIPDLIGALNHRDPDVRVFAQNGFSRMRSDTANHAVSALLNVVQTKPDLLERRRAVRAIGSIGPLAKDAVPTLIDVFRKNEDRYLSDHTACTIGYIGLPAAKPAIPIFLEALEQPNPDLREYAGSALVTMGIKKSLTIEWGYDESRSHYKRVTVL